MVVPRLYLRQPGQVLFLAKNQKPTTKYFHLCKELSSRRSNSESCLRWFAPTGQDGTHRRLSWNVRFSPPLSADFLVSVRSAVWRWLAQGPVRLLFPRLGPRGNGGFSIPSRTRTSPSFPSSVLTARTPVPSSLSRKDSPLAKCSSTSKAPKVWHARAMAGPFISSSPLPAPPSTSLFSSIAASARFYSSPANSSAAASRTASSARTASFPPAPLRFLSTYSASSTAAGPAAHNSPPPIPSSTRAFAKAPPLIRPRPKSGTPFATEPTPSRLQLLHAAWRWFRCERSPRLWSGPDQRRRFRERSGGRWYWRRRIVRCRSSGRARRRIRREEAEGRRRGQCGPCR